MNNYQIYNNLIRIAEQSGIKVKEKNLKTAGIDVKSGLCKIRGEHIFIMDKHKKLTDKINILSSSISKIDIENIYIIPAIRKIFEKYEKVNNR